MNTSGPTKTATGVQTGPSDSLCELLLHATVGSAWLSERRTLSGKSLAGDAHLVPTVTASGVAVSRSILPTGADPHLSARRTPQIPGQKAQKTTIGANQPQNGLVDHRKRNP